MTVAYLATGRERRWPGRVAFVLAMLALLVNLVIAVVYGWLLDALFGSVMRDEPMVISPDTLVSGTVPMLVIGELWYLTPVLWLAVMGLGLLASRGRLAQAAMGLATLSLFVFAALLAWTPR